MAAVTNWNPAAGVISDRDYADLLDKRLDDLRKAANSVVMVGEKYLAPRNATQRIYRGSTVSTVLDLPQVNEDGDQLPWVQPVKGFPYTITTATYRSAVGITREMVESDEHNMVNALLSGLPNSVKQRKEYLYAQPFNLGFTTELGADGVSVFNDSHPHQDPAAGTWDNNMTAAAPSTSALSDMWVQMQNFTNEKGFPMNVSLKNIVCGVTLYPTLKKILSATQEAENALNAPNIWNGVITLDDAHKYVTSTTAWFGRGDMSMMDEGFLRIERAPETYIPLSPENPDIIYTKRARFAMAVGVDHAKNWIGNLGA